MASPSKGGAFCLMPRYLLTIAYDGTAYCGWQVQKNALSIQSLVQKALETALRVKVDLTGAGRTDAGVHAYGQTAHFETDVLFDLGKLLVSLNALLPPDIRILSLRPVAADFHARYSAKGKVYHYHLHLDRISSPFTAPYRFHLLEKVSIEKLREGAKLFLGKRNFASFANAAHRGSASRDPVRTLLRFDVVAQPGGVRFELEADGFLYRMVRNLVGTLIDFACERCTEKEIGEMFLFPDRRRAGFAAPPQGLFLMEVKY